MRLETVIIIIIIILLVIVFKLSVNSRVIFFFLLHFIQSVGQDRVFNQLKCKMCASKFYRASDANMSSVLTLDRTQHFRERLYTEIINMLFSELFNHFFQ